MQPLNGVLVVAIEQAVAAPLCTARLREAGARVIKIEREGGDFARGYDRVAGGDSSYFMWTNLGKESLVIDFKDATDANLLHRILARADVLVQNLAPGALARAGFDSAQLRRQYPRLITCDISGYGDNQNVHLMKAYDLLIQAESGLLSISGGDDAPGRIGVSVCDIGAGMNAHAGILEALLKRARTGVGSGLAVSLFGTVADWMTVPLLHHDYGGKAPPRAGLNHPSIAPYGGYPTRDRQIIIIAIQNEREWARFCAQVLRQPALADDPRFNGNGNRVAHRGELDAMIVGVTGIITGAELTRRLTDADVAYGAVNSVAALSVHPALARRQGLSGTGAQIEFPARPIHHLDADATPTLQTPTVGAHSARLRQEFGEYNDAP